MGLLSTTPEASHGPALRRVNVKATGDPTQAGLGEAVCWSERSLMGVASFAVRSRNKRFASVKKANPLVPHFMSRATPPDATGKATDHNSLEVLIENDRNVSCELKGAEPVAVTK